MIESLERPAADLRNREREASDLESWDAWNALRNASKDTEPSALSIFPSLQHQEVFKCSQKKSFRNIHNPT